MIFGAREVRFDLPKSIITTIHNLCANLLQNKFDLVDEKELYFKHIAVADDSMIESYKSYDESELGEVMNEQQFNMLQERTSLIKNLGLGVDIRQYHLRPKFADLIKNSLPETLKQFDPVFNMQFIGTSRNFVPHMDFDRNSSLMYPIISGDATTVWYDKTEDFEIFPALKVFDPTKIRKVMSVKMEEKHWYVFDHASCHSVGDYDTTQNERVAFLIEFANLSPQDLFDIVNEK
jgi:hypothetical protein